MTRDLKSFLEFTIFESGKFKLQVFNILNIVIIFLLAALILWVISKFFKRQRAQGRIDQRKAYALVQVSSYIVYTIAILLAIDSIGIKITVLLAGSTALLVGLGLGLQDFFRDLVAGFIILWERTVTSGDIVEIGGVVGQVKEVGLRTTSLITREEIVLIVPNTRLTTDNVINWSQNNNVTRFRIDVGVAYGSDTALVEKILVECAKEHKDVLNVPEPYVFFKDFGNSSLDFSLLFFSQNLFRIERTKSDIRFAIDRKFRESKVIIPFPQRDIWVRQMPSSDV
ncbi:MAG: mechanosensitive ion channel protein MscS [Owenweeksia sp.]|nr:mechanosensitive ion channel protein MscS [Owenweeksia sp.]